MASSKRLTELTIPTLKHDAKKRKEIPDRLRVGLYLILQPGSDTKSWAVRYRFDGVSKKLTLGKFPKIGLVAARDMAREKLQSVDKGIDPAEDKKRDREDTKAGKNLFANIAAQFLVRHAKKRRSAAEMERALAVDILPKWGRRQVQDITRRDVNDLLDGLLARGVTTHANRIFSLIRKLFNWMVEKDILAASPCIGMKPPVEEKSRERVLSDDEVRWFWEACNRIGYPFGNIFKMMLLTLQREGEVGALVDAELDLKHKLWTLPAARAKNNRANLVSLSEPVLAILKASPRIWGEAGYIFTTNGKTPVSGWSRVTKKMRALMLEIAREERGKAVEIPHWQPHDLRRTGATGLQALSIAQPVTEAILNHKSGVISGIAAVYAKHEYRDEKRAALDAWARKVMSLVDPSASDNIVRLTGRA